MFEIRPYHQDDRPALERMARMIVEDGTVFPFEDVEGVFDYWFSDGADVWVAEQDGDVVGSYSMHPNHPDRGSHVANSGYMVRGDQRGRGIGERLGNHSLERARELGYSAVQFNQVVSTNTSAIRLWERLGFVVLARVPEAFRHPEMGLVDTLIMHRRLQARDH